MHKTSEKSIRKVSSLLDKSEIIKTNDILIIFFRVNVHKYMRHPRQIAQLCSCSDSTERRADRYFAPQLQTDITLGSAIWNLVYVPLRRHPSTVNKFQRFASVRFSAVASTRFAIHHPAKCFAKCSFDPGLEGERVGK